MRLYVNGFDGIYDSAFYRRLPTAPDGPGENFP